MVNTPRGRSFSSSRRASDIALVACPFHLFFSFPFPFSIPFLEYNSTCTVEITQYALKGQKFLAQGNALGSYERQSVAL
ncbi:MAG TPA: hypothetical protein DCG20_07725 [Prevotella sp.]|nr:hypothetical protein [Prevotella sp.]